MAAVALTLTFHSCPPTSGFSPDDRMLSECMVGKVSVDIIFIESDPLPGNDDDWTPDKESYAREQINACLQWWRAKEPRAGLKFITHWSKLGTSVEPLKGASTDAPQWIGEALTLIGETGATPLDQIISRLNRLRTEDDADWAVMIVIVPGQIGSLPFFSDGKYSNAPYGGPFVVMTLGDYTYPPSPLDGWPGYLAAAFAHAFYAVTEGQQAGNIDLSERWGYLAAANDWREIHPSTNCVMVEYMRAESYCVGDVCVHTRLMLGWRDSDGDDLLDVVDAPPELTIMILSASGEASGSATGSPPFPNNNPYYMSAYHTVADRRDASINRVTGINYRILNAQGAEERSWAPVRVTSGTLDAYALSYSAKPDPPLGGGSYTLEVKAINSQNLSTIKSASFTVPHSLGGTVEAPQATTSAIQTLALAGVLLAGVLLFLKKS